MSRSSSRKRRRKSAAAAAEPAAPPAPTDYQSQAMRELIEVATSQPQELRIIEEPYVEPDGNRIVRVAIAASSLPARAPKGGWFRPVEEFWISLESELTRPPAVMVDHYRFLGVPHVMSGSQICLYLDPSRDWNPDAGIRGVLDRLWAWMEDAAADRFRPEDALYHAVGSVTHHTAGTPTVVVRQLPDQGRHIAKMHLRRRTGDRLDLVVGPADPGDLHVPVLRLRRDIPIGAGRDVLADLLHRLELTQGLQPLWPDDWVTSATRRLFAPSRPTRPFTLAEHAVSSLLSSDLDLAVMAFEPAGHRRPVAAAPLSPAAELAAAMVDSATRNPAGSHQYALLAVPHPNGGAGHLLSLRISPKLADSFRAAAATSDGALDPYEVVRRSARMAMEWCPVSDERPQVTTRRDAGRPVQALYGRTVHVWGVGGLGSWMAEYVVRAGASRIVVHDPGRVTGGLLVRQNYVEDDIGAEKAQALVKRLRAIRDDVDVDTLNELPEGQVGEEMLAADLVIDATINNLAGNFFDGLSKHPARRSVLARVATDVRTGTLGLAVISAPNSHWQIKDAADESAGERGASLAAVDEGAGEQVGLSSALEPYRVFWERPLPGEEFVPTRGCSVPTFHGSAADLSAVAGCLLNFVAMHIGTSESGTHLMSLPHSGVTPGHHFVAHGAASAWTRIMA